MSRVQFALRWVTTVAVVGSIGCFAPQGSEVEHDNVTFAVSPDGQNVVFSAADGDLYLLSLSVPRVSRLTQTEGKESEPAFSPDGKAIIYAATVPGTKGSCLFIRTLDGKQVRQLTNDHLVTDSMPCFSLDGKLVSFVRAQRHRPYSMGGWTWDNFDVYVMSLNGTNQRRVTRHNFYQAAHPCFIANGTAILFSADGDYPDSRTYLFTVPTDGTQPPKRLTTTPKSQDQCAVWGSNPSLSPDGKQIAFISDRADPFQYDVLTMSPDGTDTRPLGVTRISRYNQTPVFLPDGKSILFLAGTEWNAHSRPIFSLWQVKVDASAQRRIAGSGLFTDPMHWRPEASSPTKTP